MIIGTNKKQVIENIKEAVKQEDFHRKVEVDDPKLSNEEKQALVACFLKKRRTFKYKVCNGMARVLVNGVTRAQNHQTKVVGLEYIKGIEKGAIITSNHFNPLDNTVVRKAMRKAGKRRLYIVSQETNLAMKGLVGFLMNYADIIPISANNAYMKKDFPTSIEEKLKKKQVVLIYPEQEMWFNYRKPRPPKRGAYYYAACFGVPIISCFVEIKNLAKKENDEFYETQCIIHILPPIYPDPAQNLRDNSLMMMKQDYKQKKAAYEAAYGKPLTYEFEEGDIAGWITKA